MGDNNLRELFEAEAREMYRDLDKLNLGTHDITEEHFVRAYVSSRMVDYAIDEEEPGSKDD